MKNWLSIALTPFDLKHIEYYLRFAVIPVTVTGVYLGVVADWTAGFYPVDGFNYHALERQILFFVAYSYFLLNWAAYVARYVGKYDGPRALVSPFIITMGMLVCVFLSGIDQLEPWGSLFANFGEYGEYSFIYLLTFRFLGSWFLLILLNLFKTGKLNLDMKAYFLNLIYAVIFVFLVFDVMGGTVIFGISWVLQEIGFLDPFKTFQSILYAILHVMMMGAWLSVLTMFLQNKIAEKK